MKQTCLTLSFVTFVFLSFIHTQAQQFTRKESPVTMGGPFHDIIRCPNGDQLVITYPLVLDKEPLPIAITRFDPQLAIRYNNPLKELAGFHYRGAVYSGGRLFMVFNNKEGAVSRYEVDEKTGQLIGKPLSLFSLAEQEEDGTFYTGNAPSKNFHYCFWKNAKEKKGAPVTLQGVILNKAMDITARFSFTTPEEREDYDNLEVVQSDQGVLTIIYSAETKTKRDEYMPLKYTLLQVDEKGHTSATPLTGLPMGRISPLSWTIQHDQLIFTGLSEPEKRKDVTRVIGGRYDQASKKIVDVRQTEISTLLSNSPAFLKLASGKGLWAVTLSRALTMADGSRILVLEGTGPYRHEGYVGGIMTPVHVTPGPVENMWQTNVYVVKVDPNNTPLWFDIVSKYQLEQDTDLRLGIGSLLDEKNNLQLFFYDREKHTDPSDLGIGYVDYVSVGNKMKENVKLACVTIAQDGKIRKQFVQNTADYEFHLMPQYSLSGEGNVLYFMAIKYIRARTSTYYLTHSDYRYGVLSINY